MDVAVKKPNPIDVEVGSRIRLRRNLLAMSQTSLAEALGITFQQVQKYEKGTNRVGGSRLQAIACALQVPISFFFDTPDQAEPQTCEYGGVMQFLATSDGLKLNKAFPLIKDAALRKRVLNLIEALTQDEQPRRDADDVPG